MRQTMPADWAGSGKFPAHSIFNGFCLHCGAAELILLFIIIHFIDRHEAVNKKFQKKNFARKWRKPIWERWAFAVCHDLTGKVKARERSDYSFEAWLLLLRYNKYLLSVSAVVLYRDWPRRRSNLCYVERVYCPHNVL